jgi:F-type H+-transporting ATPase subunit epsilon
METTSMDLKIILPFRVFIEVKNVKRIVLETSEGFYGLLPQRLDCVAALVPGIFTYETEKNGDNYIAIDEGILIKTGAQVQVAVRNAIGGADLGKLHELIKKQFMNIDEKEKNVRLVMAKMESGFIKSLKKMRKE